jgi:Tol biopolymer transport system component
VKGIIIIVAAAVVAIVLVAAQSARQLELALVDRNGNRERVGFLPLATFAPRISPNGRQLLFDTLNVNDAGMWIADFPSLAQPRRLPEMGQFPMWSADGERIIFNGLHEREQALFWRKADGTGSPELLSRPARAPEHWSAKMQSLTFITLAGSDYDVWRYSLAEKKASALVVTPGSSQHSSRLSPDERWIAYVSDESGRFEVYVQPLPTTGDKLRVTSEGGEHPIWSPDGREIYYDHAGGLFAVKIQTEPAFSAGTPERLPITGFIQGTGRRQFDLTADGKRFLMLFPETR